MDDRDRGESPNGEAPGTAPVPAQPRRLLVRLYREELDTWHKHYRKYFKHAARTLGLGFVAGFLYFTLQPGQEKKALEYVVRSFKDIRLEDSPLALALTLFTHNAWASVVALAAGAVPFLFLPILDPLLNGAVLGLLVSITKHQGFDVPRLILTQILPHGVFELAGVLYATSLGLYLSAGTGKKARAAWRKRKRQRRAGPAAASDATDVPETCPECGAAGPDSLARNVVRSFVLVVLPLLLVAAFVEGFITPGLR